MSKNKQALLVFAKAPVPGKAKTRLIPKLGAEGAAELHQELVLRTLERLVNSQWDTLLWTAGDSEHSLFQDCDVRFDLKRYVQQGDDLGQRMYHAMKTCLESYESVCLVGTDCPVLDEQIVAKVFRRLDNLDMVFNPAEDGGYVLLAANTVDPRVFENIRWGTSEVMGKTRVNLKKLNYDVSFFPVLWDVDVPEDLSRYYALARALPPE